MDLLNNRKGAIINDPEILKKYNSDWSGQYIGKSPIVVRPKTTKEVSSIMEYCNSEKIGVTPQSGNTGVVGGSVPIKNEVILSMEGLNEIISFDEDNGILYCEAGCILQTLQDKVSSDYDHLVPIDLGAKGTCMIGGNFATNAGGQYFFRFGSIHANVIGIEVVLPNGNILDLMTSSRKDNTGYDLKHLFIGAEGTLGVITKVGLTCPRLPRARNTVFLACNTFDDVLKTMSCAKEELGEILAAYEFMDKEVLDQVASEKKIPIVNEDGENYRFCVLVETQGSNDDHDNSKMESFLEMTMENGHVIDGVMAQDLSQVHEMWEIRESCNPVIKSQGCNYKYDLSLPMKEYYDIAEEMRERLSSRTDIMVVNWGHVIDGNIHLNIITPGKFDVDQEVKDLIEPYIFESVVKRGGSISAEHGLGQCKNNLLGIYAKNDRVLSVMQNLKTFFDPNGICNPGKFLPTKATP
eukprot:CAMPEP_0194121046 /NCGR_PEP_ID=MMETSP0150-20130528/45469_1 /TAXON_ID=122233 /ORGANISM="Chaetoceros debilis, Strain MM31A-1" /LENGTH=465 /DNA_ID=CAMNT_0038813335 /DNA_START=218 /DNA_END=1615 /DNA_ORIENTATION=+